LVAICSGPSTPPASVLFSITIGWPRCFSVAAASARSPMSVVPPAANGTISVTGRVGKSCAWPNQTETSSATALAIACRTNDRFIQGFLQFLRPQP
jgi:hypothetical protein